MSKTPARLSILTFKHPSFICQFLKLVDRHLMRNNYTIKIIFVYMVIVVILQAKSCVTSFDLVPRKFLSFDSLKLSFLFL